MQRLCKVAPLLDRIVDHSEVHACSTTCSPVPKQLVVLRASCFFSGSSAASRAPICSAARGCGAAQRGAGGKGSHREGGGGLGGPERSVQQPGTARLHFGGSTAPAGVTTACRYMLSLAQQHMTLCMYAGVNPWYS
jgi:hypothetical protein